ncbi:MAG TPA: PQQ-binding-like beta-propeller repeat protein [Vicinamibacterales bacterium]|nr:PQQ-binding-like beta-propeller repeat protein [Vicinamibacterales bacterium]
MLRLLACCLAIAAAQSAAAPSDWPRFGYDAGRSNASTAPTGIDAGNISAAVKQKVPLDGTVDASPIYLANVTVHGEMYDVFFVTTTYGKTIAIDADDGSVLWEFTPSGYSSWAGSAQITNTTPAADADRQNIYAASPDGRIQKLAVDDGHVVWSTPITMLPQREKMDSPLNVLNGRVYATTGGYSGDAPPYQGHIVILDAGSGQIQHVWNSLCSDRPGIIDPNTCPQTRSAMWGRAGAVIDTATGNILVATGNGRWDGRTSWGDAALELNPDATQLLGAYTPANTDALEAADLDLGSTSPALLDGDLIAQGGKDGAIRLLSRQRMRGFAPGGEAQTVSTPSGDRLYTAPAVVRDGGVTTLFTADAGATAAWLLDRGAGGDSAGLLRQLWRVPNGGTSPVVAGGLLYVYSPAGALRVYDPGTGRLVTTLACGSGHWNSPIVVDERIALPEGNANLRQTSGVLDIWRVTRRAHHGGPRVR